MLRNRIATGYACDSTKKKKRDGREKEGAGDGFPVNAAQFSGRLVTGKRSGDKTFGSFLPSLLARRGSWRTKIVSATAVKASVGKHRAPVCILKRALFSCPPPEILCRFSNPRPRASRVLNYSSAAAPRTRNLLDFGTLAFAGPLKTLGVYTYFPSYHTGLWRIPVTFFVITLKKSLCFDVFF